MYTAVYMHTVVVYKVTLVHDKIIYLSQYLEIEYASCELLNAISKFIRPGVVALIGKRNYEGVLDFNQQLV